jgi:hypothetical protein
MEKKFENKIFSYDIKKKNQLIITIEWIDSALRFIRVFVTSGKKILSRNEWFDTKLVTSNELLPKNFEKFSKITLNLLILAVL